MPASGEPFVLKQSRPQLRTRDPWFSRLDRIWREAEVMRLLEPLLPRGVVPRVLFEDRENYLFLMEAAPAEHVVWKQRLLEGVAEPHIAEFLGACLATLHRETAYRPDLAEQFGDREVFVQLRVDPFYRRVAEACAEVRPQIERMIDAMFATSVCLVHADFSPKNVLIAGERIVLVDYETGHYGDPAFDLGFFLSHLLLKTIRHRSQFDAFAELTNAFWREYRVCVEALDDCPEFAPESVVGRMVPHLAGCMWARIDGTSRIDYLPDPREQQAVRDFCRGLFLDPPSDWDSIIERLRGIVAGISGPA
jgi:5-methylthioribose kinase